MRRLQCIQSTEREGLSLHAILGPEKNHGTERAHCTKSNWLRVTASQNNPELK